MKKILTPRQSEILSVIKDFKYSYDKVPSIRKIASQIGVSSPNAVKQHMDALISKGYLTKDNNKYRILEDSDYVQIRVLGYANAGQPLSFAEQDSLGTISINNNVLRDHSDYFAVVVQGDSMNKQIVNGKKISDNSYAIIKNTQNYDYSKPVLVVVNGSATIKNIAQKDNYFVLYPNSTNKKHREIFIQAEDDLYINGVVVDVLPSMIEN